MANSTGDYENILIQFLPPFVCLGILVLPNLMMALFIVAVNVIGWLKDRSILGADKIIICLELSKVFFHIVCLLYFFAVFFFPESSIFFLISLEFMANFATCFSICLSTLHFIFIYFKMSTFHNVFLLRLKAIISQRVVYLIITSVLLSSGFSFLHILDYLNQLFRHSIQNFILHYNLKKTNLEYFHIFWNMSPLLMGFLCSFLVMISLVLHMVRMNNSGNVTCNTDTYQRTIRFTFLSMLIWVLYIITYVIGAYIESFGPWYAVIINIISGLHSVMFIYAATKLRNRFLRIVHCGTDCLFNRIAPGPRPRESVQMTTL